MTRASNLRMHNQYKTWADRKAASDDVLADTPDAVTGFTATQQSATEIDLAWTNPAGQTGAVAVIARAAAAGAGGATANTFTDSGDTVDDVAHGLVDGDRIMFDTVVTTTGVVINTSYYVVNAVTDAFQIEATVGGGALTLTTDGSGTYFVPTFAHTEIDKVDAADEAFSDTGLTTDTEYEYSVSVANQVDQTAAVPLAYDTTA